MRDFRTIIVVMVIPVVLLLLFGFAISTEVNDVRVVAIVEQHTDDTRQAIDRLRNNPYFTFKGITSYDQVENLLRRGKVDAAIALRTTDGRLAHQVIVDASNTVLAQTSTAYIESALGGTGGSPWRLAGRIVSGAWVPAC